MDAPPGLVLSTQPFFGLRDAKDDAVSVVTVGFQGSATLLVDRVRLAAPLQLTLAVRYWHAFYRGADRQVTDNPGFVIPGLFNDPLLKRQDDSVQVGLLAELPLTDKLSTFGGIGYLYTNSNLPNYSYDDFSTQLGLSWRF